MAEPGCSPAEPAGEQPPLPVRLRPSIEVFPAPTGEIYLLRPGERGDLIVSDPDRADRAIIEILAAGSETTEGLCSRLAECADRQAIRGKVAALRRAGALVDVPPGAEPLPAGLAERFARQLPYFAETGDAAAAQRRLRDATVVIVGCGGLGTWVLAALASAGVGGFVLVDDDAVELGNLNRQIIYAPADIGSAKVECAERWLRRFDASIRVRAERRLIRSAAELMPLLDHAAAVVQAADLPPVDIVRWVDEACRARSVPYITAAQAPPLLKVGPTYVPGETACFMCHEAAMRAAFAHYDALVAHRSAEQPAAMTLGPASGAIGTLVALELMHLIAGRGGSLATRGRAFLLDMRTLETRWDAVERRPDCRCCSSRAAPHGEPGG